VDAQEKYAYKAAPDVVFAMFCDPEFLRAKFVATEAIAYDIVESAATPAGGFRIVTNRTVEADIPGFAKKFFPRTSAMTQTEDWGTESGGIREGTWSIQPHGIPISVSTGGTTRLEPADGGAVQHIVAKIKVGVPLVGGKLERFVYEQAKKTMDLEHEFGEKWLAEHPS
jgi:uncharacterized protein DUF2505